MLESFMITFREGLEALLIVGVILGYLVQTNRVYVNKYVYAGVGLGILGSLLAAVTLNILAIEFEGRNEALFEGVVMLLAALVLTSMIIWMLKESSNISANIRKNVDSKTEYGLMGLAFVSVFREGIETVLFMGAAAMNTETSTVLYGGLLGLAASVVIAYLVFKSSYHLDLGMFFNLTSVFLILFAAGLTAHGIHELQEAALIPVFNEHLWDINHILSEDGIAGSLLKSLFGYNGNPSLLEVVSYIGYYVALGIGIKGLNSKSKTGTVQTT
ncbi:high-affinity iron transporter [Methanohalophilus sp. RSK]|uniref:FTR1 family iron permease n=1 Tax=Methanohalophilus sp. RSK TaxID=2485783 RepID=UPI000F43AF06|nr:FTR1 family protein [Methanohalophilus sp. RSK]RNI12935.1 high-affinity iron transporter [Methanohalophilus sp. RSK]